MDINLELPEYRSSILNFLSLKQGVLGAYAWRNFVTEGKGIVMAEVDLLDAEYRAIVLTYIADAVIEENNPALAEAKENLEASGTLRLLREYDPNQEIVVGVVYLGQMKTLRIKTTPPPSACEVSSPVKEIEINEFVETYLGWSEATLTPI